MFGRRDRAAAAHVPHKHEVGGSNPSPASTAKGPAMADAKKAETQEIYFSPGDVIGAVQRGLREVDNYLAQPVVDINPGIALQHLDRCMGHLAYFHSQMAAIHKAAEEEAARNKPAN